MAVEVALAGVPLVEVTRGEIVESVHSGVVAVANAAGELTWSAGNAALVTFPRSALKPFQLLALAARGGLERFSFTADEVAVMVGSHGGEPMHVDRVRGVLDKIDAPESALVCGAQVPMDAQAAADLRRAGTQPRAVHNNCSGKHAGMLALARLLDAPLADYTDPRHPAQSAIRESLLDFLQLQPEEMLVGIDGCSAPAYALPMRSMGRGFALIASPDRAPESWRGPLTAIARAMRQHPRLVGGSHGRLDTELMRLDHGLVAKSGAEGYFCVGHPTGVGVAVKIVDGDSGGRARGLATVTAAHRLSWIDDDDFRGNLASFGPRLPMHNLAGRQTGEVRPAATVWNASDCRGDGDGR